MDNIITIPDKNLTLCQTYNSCFYSSFVFLINVSINLYYGYYLYASLFLALVITSLLQHSQYTLLTKILDKIAIFTIVFYGGYTFYNKITDFIFNEKFNINQIILSILIILTFVSTIVLYYYGYLNNCLCFCDNRIEANLFHSFMHCIGSFGHCCIVIL
jgi:cation transport ATPase